MANFSTWINKNNNKSTMNSTTSNLSPRQVANKAYTLAIKKLDRDDKRCRPQYTVRERLLLSNTMAKAEDVLNKRTPRFNRRVLACETDDDILPPAPVVKKVQEQPNQVLKQQVTPTPPAVVTSTLINSKNESPIVVIITKEQQQIAAVSIAVVAAAAAAAAAAYSMAAQEKQLSSPDNASCRPVMIPSHTNMTSITTII
jgi:hypothetical protein